MDPPPRPSLQIVWCTPIAAPTVGWIADPLVPRWAPGVWAAFGFAAAAIALLRSVTRRAKALESAFIGQLRFVLPKKPTFLTRNCDYPKSPR